MKCCQVEEKHDFESVCDGDMSVQDGRDAEVSGPKKRLRLLIKIGKLVVLTLVVVWLVLQLKTSWSEVLKYEWNPQWGWLIASGCFYLCGFFPAACLWFLSMRWLGQKPSFFDSIFAYYASQLGKYAPGKAMVIVIRAGMIASNSVSASVAAVAVFYETLTMMGSGAFIGSLIVFFFFRENAFYSLIALGIAACSIAPLLPPVFSRALTILKVGKNDPKVEKAIKNLRVGHLALGILLTSILWLCFGLSLWAVVQGVGLDSGSLIENLPRYVASVALATSFGFAVFISPGGLGVREALLSALLTPYFALILTNPDNAAFQLKPEALATLVSLVQRIISMIAEVSIFVVLTSFNVNLRAVLKRR